MTTQRYAEVMLANKTEAVNRGGDGLFIVIRHNFAIEMFAGGVKTRHFDAFLLYLIRCLMISGEK